jgi:hypothetical protein
VSTSCRRERLPIDSSVRSASHSARAMVRYVLVSCASLAFVNGHVRSLRNRVRKLTTVPAPDPWRSLPVIAVGGLAAVGFTDDSKSLLVLSSAGGRSLYDTGTGERIARDRDANLNNWLSEDNTMAAGIGVVADDTVHVAGLWGGGLSTLTSDGWSCTVVAPDWPIERVVLQPPGADVITERFASGCVQIADSAVSDLRVAGFSPDGRTLVVATAADITLWTR